VKARLLTIPADRRPLYAPWIVEALAEIHTERTLESTWLRNVEEELRRDGADPASLLLVAEVVDPLANATPTAPAGYAEASILWTIPDRDPLLGGEGAVLRVLHTKGTYRQRGFATGLLRQAEQLLTARGVAGLRVDVPYGDDAITGVFERREYMRGRMALHRGFQA
jgi:ribosomal protein S18 acetylase RimI-like enzyme